ncbi:hypothetical protein J2Z21_004289 [Streptomyces griseochromogenes]|uniref:DUF7144 domain-containing protein n=1 Tax=Streptomyces griseochromogenes TaxID=68214 RepID=A0A1B1AVJ0_9ACTN|nr:hypothetical protein [Streptomyces griseochromogenes]ANP50551.1 hypothetical protein AVL59_13795 [Streptomyces griseochromogenes]MBP2051318.1 hypothetical protein [Streptomyces griseochromogenes]
MSATHRTQTQTTRLAWASGLTTFAAVMLMITGVLDLFRGIMGIAQDDIFVTTPNYVFRFDLTGWGWIHLALGILAMIVGLGLLQPSTWARVAGVTIAGLIIIANFLSLPYSPVWSVVMIAISGFVIWALCVVRSDTSPQGSQAA